MIREDFLFRSVRAEKKAADEGSFGTLMLIGLSFFFPNILMTRFFLSLISK